MAFYSFSPTLKTEKETIEKDGASLVSLNLSLPCLPEERDDAFAKRLNGLYTKIGEGFKGFCRGPLLKRAEKSKLKAELDPFAAFGAVIRSVPAFENAEVFSVYFEVKLTMGELCSLSRHGQTFRKENGNLLAAESFFKKGSRSAILRLLGDEAKRREEQGIARLYPDYERRLRRFYKSKSFYLSPTGFVFFYGEGELSRGKGICPLCLRLEDCAELLSEEGKGLLLS